MFAFVLTWTALNFLRKPSHRVKTVANEWNVQWKMTHDKLIAWRLEFYLRSRAEHYFLRRKYFLYFCIIFETLNTALNTKNLNFAALKALVRVFSVHCFHSPFESERKSERVFSPSSKRILGGHALTNGALSNQHKGAFWWSLGDHVTHERGPAGAGVDGRSRLTHAQCCSPCITLSSFCLPRALRSLKTLLPGGIHHTHQDSQKGASWCSKRWPNWGGRI